MNDKVAVVGISCIAPGAKKYSELWNNLINKKESIIYTKVENAEKDSCSYIRVSGDIENFEKIPIMGIKEEIIPFVDPQLNLLYTLVGHAIKDCTGSIYGKERRTGVFCSSDSSFDWKKSIVLPKHLQNSYYLKEVSYVSENQYYSSMISYLYGFTGQSVGVSAACASSLAAVHMAVSSLLLGDIDCGIAGGG